MLDMFVDREDLRDNLLEILEKIQNENTVFILSGKSGYGKSAFCRYMIRKIEKDFHPDFQCHRVSIPIGDNISLNEGMYYRLIAQYVSENSEKYGYDNLQDFLKKTKNPVLKKIYNHHLLDNSASLSSVVQPLTTILSHYDSSDFFSEYNYFLPEDSRYLYLILSEYLTECIGASQKVIINIENIQNIDRLSLVKMIDLLKKTNNLFLLLEYTSNDNSLVAAKQFENNFILPGTRVITKQLYKLDYEHTCEIISKMYPDNQKINNTNSLREIYLTIDGNIRQLSDVESVFELKDIEENDTPAQDYTFDRLKDLSNAHSIQILCLIYAHMSQVEESHLKHILNTKSYSLFIKYSDIMSDMTSSNGLIEIENGLVKFKHDSIRENIKKISKFEPKIALSYNWWISFYENELHNPEGASFSKKSTIIKLCYFYSNYKPDTHKILNLIPSIRKIALECVNPEEATSFILNFYDSTEGFENKNIKNQLERFLIDLYYELGIYDKAYDILQIADFDDEQIKFLYDVMLQDRLRKETQVLQLIDDKLSTIDTKTNAHFFLCLNLVKIIAAASSNQYKICEDTFALIEENKELYSTFLEYGFFLRNSEIILPLKDSLSYLRKSVEFFQDKNHPIYEAHTRISLLMNCARLGEFEEAESHYQIAHDILEKESLEKHILLNDWVALQMCKGDFNLKMKNDLVLAMCTAQTIFDKIIINKNLLLLYAKNKCWKEGEEIVDLLLEYIEDETNKLNICFTYWDISYFYKYYQEDLYRYYFDKYKSLYEDLQTRPLRKSVTDTDVAHKPNMEFVIEFISYWHFPIPKVWLPS